jgi:predicted dehydrogenase
MKAPLYASLVSNRVSRRSFLHSSALAAGATVLGAPALLRGQNLNNKLNVAVVGCGGRGGGNMSEVGKTENIVALCDVFEPNIAKAAEKFSQAKKYSDFRKLFDDAKNFDAVVCSTTEHTHASVVMRALKRKKHVYCEKPLTHDVYECRQIRQTLRGLKVATQMGTQIHAGDNYRRVVELIQSGAIGPVREAHVWVDRTWGRQSEDDAKKYGDRVVCLERPKEEEPVPAGLNWDLWIGPAPFRPFNSIYIPGSKWYRWWDFGNGTMSDLGSHWNDLPFWALKLDAPLTIEAAGPAPHPEIAPATMSATYTYGARGDMPPVKLTWYQGQMKPPQYTEGKIPQWKSAVLFVGDKGMVLSDYGKHMLLPEEKFKDFKRPEPFIPKSLGHHAEWIDACKTGKPTTCNFEYSGALTEANHLGNVAYRLGKKLEWDTAALKVTNCSEAAALIRRPYRKGWTLV